MFKLAPSLPVVALVLSVTAGCASTSGTNPAAATPTAEAGTPEPVAKAGSEPAAPAATTNPTTPAAAKQDGELTDEQKKAKEKEEKEKKEKEEAKKKYEELTEKLTKSEGLFTTWHDDDSLFLELTEKDFGRHFLYAGALGSGAGSGAIYRGAMLSDNDFVLQLQRRGDKKVILLAENNRYLEPG